MKTATRLSRSFIEIKNLSDNMFNAGNIQTIDYCLEVYRQYTSGEVFDPFYGMHGKLKGTYLYFSPN